MKSFRELLEMQKELDEAIEKPRKNGFKPKFRNYRIIVKSMIAEIIEFNEETKNTHKTWKQKEFDKNKVIEESVDILFFYLQLVNLVEKTDKRIIDFLNSTWEESWKNSEKNNSEIMDIELLLIKKLSDMDWCLIISKCLDVMGILVQLYVDNGITREVVENFYEEKWQKNMDRINGEWSNI